MDKVITIIVTLESKLLESVYKKTEKELINYF